MMPSDTWSGFSPVFCSSDLMTFAPSSAAGIFASEPPNLPTAVRVAATMTMSSSIFNSPSKLERNKTLKASLRLGFDVAPRGRLDCAMFAAAQLDARWDSGSRVLRQPLAPCGPPTSRHAPRPLQPTVRSATRPPVHPVVAPSLHRRMDDPSHG